MSALFGIVFCGLALIGAIRVCIVTGRVLRRLARLTVPQGKRRLDQRVAQLQAQNAERQYSGGVL